MPATVALVFALCGAMLIGVIVFFIGVMQVATARRGEAPVRAPLIATGVGFAVVLAAGVTLAVIGVGHMVIAFQTFSALR